MLWPPATSLWGLIFTSVFSCLSSLTLYHFSLALTTGPGFLPLQWSPGDSGAQSQLQQCGQCEGYKAPRSHHCRRCNRCVMKMDHHCPWINTCVGHYNHGKYWESPKNGPYCWNRLKYGYIFRGTPCNIYSNHEFNLESFRTFCGFLSIRSNCLLHGSN